MASTLSTSVGAGRARRAARLGLPAIGPHRRRVVVLLVLVFGFYLWTAASTVPFQFGAGNPADQDPYNQLTTAFLHGHTYLATKPPAALLHLRNPYDPAQNATVAGPYHDLELYHGRFYLQWGPTPVITLFAPFRLTGLWMPQSLAVALFGFAGLACAVLLLHALVRRFLPETPRWALLVATVGLALTNVLPFLLRRPIEYEVAISCGYCFEMAGLLCMLTAVLGPEVRRGRLALGSLCLGLAVGGRPDLALGAVIAIVIGAWLVVRRHEPRTILAYALGPLIVCGLLLGLYNSVRFGGFSDFGDRYELAGINQMTAPFYKLAWILPGMLSYFEVPVRLSLTFPHAFLQTAAADPISLPAQYFGSAANPNAEPAGGVLTSMPITLFVLALPVLWRQRRPDERGLLLVVGGLALTGLAIAVVLSYAVFATTERYEVDFVTFFLLAGFLVWMALLAWARRGTLLRRMWAVLGVLLTAFGAAVGVAIGLTGYYNLLETEHPSTFAALEDATGPLVTLATMILDKPEITRVTSTGAAVTLPPTGYGAFSQDGAGTWLGTGPATVTIVSPRSGTAGLLATVSPGTGAPPVSSMVIVARNGNRPPSAAPVSSQVVRIPISLHTGLNRVRLTLGHPTLAQELQIANLQVGS